MKKSIILTGLFGLMLSKAIAQGEENVWVFGGQAGLDFTTTTVTPVYTNITPPFEGCASICDANGQLLFYSAGAWVWNKNHELMPELTGGVAGFTSPISPTIGYPGIITSPGTPVTQSAAICTIPSQKGKYYLFSLGIDGRLLYSIIDMGLHNGKGGIVAGKKGIFLATGLTGKMTLVKGCNSIWLVVRSLTTNQYKSFEINDMGIENSPVISNCGLLPLSWYKFGTIKFSPDGLKMAAACSETNEGVKTSIGGGIEVYDFNPYTGVLSNAQILDSNNSTGNFYGTCYSPDNSKLYVSLSSFRSDPSTFYPGRIRQYDVSLTSLSAIIASNTIVYIDSVNQDKNIGDLKRGKDGHIYFSSGQSTMPTMHRIDFPNLSGLACNVVPNAINLIWGTRGYRGLPNDIVILPAPDTVYAIKNVSVCFKDSALLIADTGKRYKWDNGSTGRQRMVTRDGIYTVSYINDNCKYQTDSFHVRFIKLPELSAVSYSCPGRQQGKLSIRPVTADTTLFTYSWKNAGGGLIQQHLSRYGDTLHAADTGTYYVQITTASGCDTVLTAKVLALPVPKASFTVDSIVCAGVSVAFTNTSVAPLWKWNFGNSGDLSDKQYPEYTYNRQGKYTASLIVTNIEGCSDTAFTEIEVKKLELQLKASTELAENEELVYLYSTGNEAYAAISWEPAMLFPDQTVLNQSIHIDTTRTFTVTGISQYGCIGKASVEVAVKPLVFMPTAFSPNGDGRNDYFRPMSRGYIFVRYFDIFDRYGEMIFSANGKAALQGWDGTYKGKPMPLGTYYYYINIEVNGNRTIQLKGDVTLLH